MTYIRSPDLFQGLFERDAERPSLLETMTYSTLMSASEPQEHTNALSLRDEVTTSGPNKHLFLNAELSYKFISVKEFMLALNIGKPLAEIRKPRKFGTSMTHGHASK